MSLRYETVAPELLDALLKLMYEDAFDNFYLVGGTALALQLGHRKSVDIDLFTHLPYGEMDLTSIRNSLLRNFPHVANIETLNERQIIYSLYIGNSSANEIKLDLCYDDATIFPIVKVDGIKMACDKEIAAMKMLAITTGNRRKDFWDIHELLDRYPLDNMIEWGLQRYPYSLDREEILQSLLNVWEIEDKTDVISLKGGYWEFVADDIERAALQIMRR